MELRNECKHWRWATSLTTTMSVLLIPELEARDDAGMSRFSLL